MGSAILGRLGDGWWFAPAPAKRLAAVRIIVGAFAVGYLALRFPHLWALADFDRTQFAPVGIVSLLDRPLMPVVVKIITLLTLVGAVAFVLGYRRVICGPLFGLVLLWTLTYRQSWGMVFHTENLLALHVMILGVAGSADAWSLDARRRAVDGGSKHSRYGWPLKLMCAVVVCAYLLAGIAKVRYSGFAWGSGDHLRNYVATDHLRKLLLDDFRSPLAPPLLGHAWLFATLAFATLVVELGAPLALVGRRLAAVWVALIVCFHWGVFALMMIGFPYQMSMVGFCCFFHAERLPTMWRRLTTRLRRR